MMCALPHGNIYKVIVFFRFSNFPTLIMHPDSCTLAAGYVKAISSKKYSYVHGN